MENVKEEVKEVVKQFTKDYVGEVVKESTKKLVKGLAKEKKGAIEHELKNKSAEEIERYFTAKSEFNSALEGTVNSVKEASLEKIQLSFEKEFAGVLPQPSLSPVERAVQWIKYPAHAGMVALTTVAIVYAILFFALPNPSPGIPSLTGPTSGVVDETYDFSASTIDPDGEKIKYTFDWDDGSVTTTELVTSGSIVGESHIWNSPGTYNIKVMATDSSDEISGWSNSLPVIIAQRITIAANGPYSGTVEIPISFAGSASGGFPPYSYSWDFGDGASSDQQNPAHAYSSAKTYNAILTITDSTGRTAQNSAQVTIVSQLISMANGPYSGTVEIPISFTGSASGGTPPYSYAWGFGDGASSDQQNPTHAYSSAKTYTAILTVTDNTGRTARDSAQVTVLGSILQ